MAKVKQHKDINQVAKSMVDFIEKKYSDKPVENTNQSPAISKKRITVKKVAKIK